MPPKEKTRAHTQADALNPHNPIRETRGASHVNDEETQELENLELGPGNGETEDMDEDETENMV